MSSGELPVWPDDILYLPVERDGKGPDVRALPGTWSVDGTGCVTNAELTDRRWGIVDVDVEGYRLLIIDLDIYKLEGKDKQTALNGLDKAPATRIHESQSGGKHLFYWIREDELEDGSLPITFASAIDDKLNGYVLSAEHCDGYEVGAEQDPVEITVSDIPDEWIKQTPDRGTSDTDTDSGSSGRSRSIPPSSDDVDVPPIHDVLLRSQYPEGERVGHPQGVRHADGGKSETGTNFMVDEGGRSWRCWRHEATGNALHLVGMEEGIFECGDWKHGGISTEKWAAVFEAAEERGLIESGSFDGPEDRWETAQILDNRTHYDSIEDVDFPDPGTNFILDKPPREGGSYGSMLHFFGTPKPLIILASRHSILEYHMETAASLLSGKDCVVHFQGRHEVCDNPDDCDKYPEGYDELLDCRNEVTDALHRNKTLTADDAPGDICPYWFLKEAAENARVTLTVPSLFPRLDRELSEVNVLMDEEQTLDFFFPGSVDLMDVGRTVEADGTRLVQLLSTNIRNEYSTLEEVRDRIKQDQHERREEAEAEDRDWRQLSYEKDILTAIETVDELKEQLGVTAASDDLSDDESRTLSNVISALEDRVSDVEFPDPTTDRDQLIEKIQKFCAPHFWDEDVNPSGLLEAVLFPYEDKPFHFKRTGSQATLRLIGDRGDDLFYKDLLDEVNQIGLIAGPEGERVLEQLAAPGESIVIDEFRYDDDFIVVPMGRTRDDRMEPASRQRDRVSRVSEGANIRRIPHIAVAGTKSQAAEHATQLPEAAGVMADPESPARSLAKKWSAGQTVVIYENSIVSRGIDAPYFDITTITSTGFATPYWEARKDYYKEQSDGDDEYLKARAVEEELKSREVTNAALRMAPTRDVEDAHGTKFIVAAASDVRKLKYLQDRTLDPEVSASDVVQALGTLAAGGGTELATSTLYDELPGKSEKAFMEAFTEKPIVPKRQLRPKYNFGDVQRWLDENHITDTDYANRVVRRVEKMDEPKTSDVKEHLPGMERGKVSSLLDVLQKKGILNETTKNEEGRGRPAKRWVSTDIPL